MAQDLIDAQFDRAVEIVQGLPTNGPIQTGYEEKLAMYSLYKQATVGNVTTTRPNIFDMLGRAKWDAWAKQKDLSTREAKWQYVETLMKVLRKYSDRTVAKDLVQELESYGDASNVVMSGTLSRTDSGSETSDSPDHEDPQTARRRKHIDDANITHEPPTSDSETDEDHEQPLPPPATFEHRRPGSAISSQNRYRTPGAGSAINVPIPSRVFSPVETPGMQPLPEHPTPSAFAPSGTPLPTSSPHPLTLAQSLSGGSQRGGSPRQQMPNHPYGPYRGTPSFQRTLGANASIQQQSPAVRPPLERAVESMQASLAALHERLESLENNLGYATGGAGGISRSSLPSHRISSPTGRAGGTSPWPVWNPADMGAWSLILQPLSRLDSNVKAFAHFLAHSDDRSPVLVIVRRLFLDLSFLIAFLLIAKSIRRRTRLRRGEVALALRQVWRALTGTTTPRVMAEAGV